MIYLVRKIIFTIKDWEYIVLQHGEISQRNLLYFPLQAVQEQVTILQIIRLIPLSILLHRINIS